MTPSKCFLVASLLLLILPSIHSHVQDHSSRCGHKHFNETQQFIDVDEEPLPGQKGRTLATSTSSSYPNIRITPDYSLLTQGSAEFISYIKTELMPPVVAYFQSALFVKQRLTSPLQLSKTSTSVCGYSTPSALFAGVSTDLYVIVSSQNDSTSNWVASAGACYLSATSYRPIIARMLFNLYYTTPAFGDVMTHEINTYLTIHEMFHALGFTQSSFSYFIDASGNLLKDAVKTMTIAGSNRLVLDVEPLTTNLRNFYGCSSIPGAIMEQDGGAGTAGSHFERRYFLYEVMTSGVMDGYRVSNFSLNLLEGSGWYLPNYTYAEPFYFGQGQGCGFISELCSAAIYDFDEYCSVASRGCTAAGRGGGTCASDSHTDGCYYMYPMTDWDCDNAEAVDNARFSTLETYGRGLGGKCFSGTLTTASKSSQTSFCFKYNCVGSGLSTTLQVFLGSGYITCKAAGQISISGYNGVLDCPDPMTFCSTVGKKYCPRNCMGRGKCVNNQCVCDYGFTGIDCALTTSFSY